MLQTTLASAESSESASMARSGSFESGLLAETSSVSVDDHEYVLSRISLKDLGRLGEGASGEVRKVLHIPSGTVMAKKASFRLDSDSFSFKDAERSCIDHPSVLG